MCLGDPRLPRTISVAACLGTLSVALGAFAQKEPVAQEPSPAVAPPPVVVRTQVITWDDMRAAAKEHDDLPVEAPVPSPAPRQLELSSDPSSDDEPSVPSDEVTSLGGIQGTSPRYGLRFPGMDLQTGLVNPPDTMGAVGPAHFLEFTNGSVAIYDKRTGLRLSRVTLRAFFSIVGGGKFDPRVLFDAHSGRWIAVAANAVSTQTPWGIVLAVSHTADPFGEWFQVFIHDTRAPFALHDFPILGVGPKGIYVGVCVCDKVGTRVLWAFEKAPLATNPPQLGAVSQWDFGSELGIPVPVHSYAAGGADLVLGLVPNPASITVYFVDGTPSSPILRSQGTITGPVDSIPPGAAEALGTDPTLGISVGQYLTSAPVYRNRTLWLVLRENANGRVGVRWMRLNPFASPPQTVQQGTIARAGMDLYFPSIAVNALNQVLVGFSGSGPETYIGAYVTGRKDGDPIGAAGPLVTMKSGEAPYATTPDANRRWGDYSATCVDPVDDLTLWTIQQYAGPNGRPDTWRLWIGQWSYAGFDCNHNGIQDACDLDCAAGGCLFGCGQSDDCQGNGVPDECEPAGDCDTNGLRDLCELALRLTPDCNENGLPDLCENAPDCDGDTVPDECELDCNENGRADECEIAEDPATDCNGNTFPDDCEAAPNYLLQSEPTGGQTLPRNRRNVLRLRFRCDLPAAPVPGVNIVVAELLDGGHFGDDLSSNFRFSVEDGSVLRVEERTPILQHGRWYAVTNAGWPTVQYFTSQHSVLVGDVSGDGRVLALDLARIKAAIPSLLQSDDDRRDINGDRAVTFADFSAALVRYPSDRIPRPIGH